MQNKEMRLTPAAIAAAARGEIENAITAATPGGIEAQEKAGQALLVASTNMPKEMHPNREAFEKIGFKFGSDVDDIFVNATLPPGWTRASSDHSMYSKIIDEQGRYRVEVFYKAAFYDRRALAWLIARYQMGTLYPGDAGADGLAADEISLTIRDGDKEIHRFPSVKRSKQFDGPRDEAEAWLAAKFPDAKDATAYW